jgi:hypothetical protein
MLSPLRHIITGRQLGDSSVFLQCAMSLAALDISKSRDSMGNVLEPSLDRTSGVLSHPKRFPCMVKPRSAQTAALIEAFEES